MAKAPFWKERTDEKGDSFGELWGGQPYGMGEDDWGTGDRDPGSLA